MVLLILEKLDDDPLELLTFFLLFIFEPLPVLPKVFFVGFLLIDPLPRETDLILEDLLKVDLEPVEDLETDPVLDIEPCPKDLDLADIDPVCLPPLNLVEPRLTNPEPLDLIEEDLDPPDPPLLVLVLPPKDFPPPFQPLSTSDIAMAARRKHKNKATFMMCSLMPLFLTILDYVYLGIYNIQILNNDLIQSYRGSLKSNLFSYILHQIS